jgi:drug/metabolite transporter (DMT)-like permease
MCGALCAAIVTVVLKKLCISKVHFSIPIAYTSYFGFPATFILSTLLFFMGISHKNFQDELKLLPMHFGFVLLAASSGLTAQILFNLALNYEDALIVAILKTFDVFIAFVLQYFFLSIKIDIFSVIGSFSIVLGTVLILIYRLFEENQAKKSDEHTTRTNKSSQVIFKCLKFKF